MELRCKTPSRFNNLAGVFSHLQIYKSRDITDTMDECRHKRPKFVIAFFSFSTSYIGII